MSPGAVLRCLAALSVAAACSGRGHARERDYQQRVDQLVGEMDRLGFAVDRTHLAVEVKQPAEARADIDRQQDLLFSPGYYEGMSALLHLFRDDAVDDPVALRRSAVESVIGSLQAYYQADRDALVFLDTALGKLADLDGLVAHELVHAWHDQHGDLEGFMARNRSSLDRVQVGRCLMEGLAEAVAAAVLMARGGRTLRDLDPAMLDASVGRLFAGEQAILPYHEGLRFMHARYVDGGWPAVRAALDAPPPSTEQLLHPEKLGRDLPTPIRLPDWPAGAPPAELRHEDTVGELMILLLLIEQGQGRSAAGLNATGWDGDRLRVWRVRGGGYALAWRTLWDREDDAHLFDAGFTRPGLLHHRRGRVVDFAWAEDPAVAARLAEALAAMPADFPLVEEDAVSTAAAEAAWLRDQERGPAVVGDRWVHPRYGLSLPIPPGWSVEEIRGVRVLVARSGAAFTDNVTVTAAPALAGGGVDVVRRELEKELARMPTLELDGVSTSSVLGGQALRVDYHGSFTAGGPRVHIAAVIIPRAAVNVTVTFTTQADRWPAVQPIAEVVLGGIAPAAERDRSP